MGDNQRHEEFYNVCMQTSREGIWRVELVEPVSIDAEEEVQLEHFFDSAIITDCNQVFAHMHGLDSPR